MLSSFYHATFGHLSTHIVTPVSFNTQTPINTQDNAVTNVSYDTLTPVNTHNHAVYILLHSDTCQHIGQRMNDVVSHWHHATADLT